MKILVTPELLEETANKFKSAQEQSQQIFTGLRQDISHLEMVWYGTTREKFYYDYQQSGQVMDKYIYSLQQIETELKRIAEKFRTTDNETGSELSKGENSSQDILKRLAIAGTVTTGKLGFILGTLNIMSNKKRADLVNIGTRNWVNGKFGAMWRELGSNKTLNKLIKDYSSPEKAAASLGKLNPALPNNSIKESNIANHIKKNVKTITKGSIILESALEVPSLITNVTSDIKKYDGLDAGSRVSADLAYSTVKVATNIGASWAGGLAGAEAGALAGSLVFPPIGTAVGALAGGIIGSTASGTIVKETINHLMPREQFKDSVANLANGIEKFFKK
ncbi:hypothetical protein BGI23_04950 [Bacillus sp. ABP14]|nr:WXG100 family type VII secretion target [Bacillus sp. ABP14]AOY14526.1 hypothetical protein BGI23_04950 [Bacillus sp. ABP14]